MFLAGDSRYTLHDAIQFLLDENQPGKDHCHHHEFFAMSSHSLFAYLSSLPDHELLGG